MRLSLLPVKEKTLDGQTKKRIAAAIVRETEKAVLLGVHDRSLGRYIQYWFPKSQIEIRSRPVIRWNGLEMDVVDESYEIFVQDWIWEKREPAKPMGCDR
jgi:hypothetical protein